MQKMQQQNPLADAVQVQLETSMQLTDAVFSGTEKIERAMRDATHQAVDGQLTMARAVAGIHNPTEMVDVRQSLATRPESVMKCQQQIMLAFAEMQNDISKSIQHYMERFSPVAIVRPNEAAQTMDTASQKASNAFFNPVSSMLSVWESAFREAAQLANRNMMAARTTMESAANATSEAVSHSVEAVDLEEHEHSDKKHARRR